MQDYVHRVGRTARAGRSGMAISLVNQYEVAWYMQIEQLIGRYHPYCSLCYEYHGRIEIIFFAGKKLPKYPAEEAEALVFFERVSDAKRIALAV